MRGAAVTGMAAMAVLGAGAHAETLQCELSPPCPRNEACAANPVTVTFAIDRNQFAPPIDPAEPPRTKITEVEMAGETFKAEPIVLDGGAVRGFWAGRPGSGSRLLTINREGRAKYSQTQPDRSLIGFCKEVG